MLVVSAVGRYAPGACPGSTPARSRPPAGSEVLMPPTVEWLSTADAAKSLGITPRTLYRFIDHGDLPAYRFGRVIRVKQSDVDAFIEASRIQPGSLEHLYPDTAARPEDADVGS